MQDLAHTPPPTLCPCEKESDFYVAHRLSYRITSGGKRVFVPSHAWAAHWAITPELWKKLSTNGAIRAFQSQRDNAKARGLAFTLTLSQWWQLWDESGKWDLRGRGHGRYCMSRYGDRGGYELGNVHIQLVQQNSREAAAVWSGKAKRYQGVFLLYPGRAKPYQAKAGKTTVGYYASEEEAAAARAEYLQVNP